VETERQKILVIGKTECLNEELSGYAIQLAQRLRYDLFVVRVQNLLPLSQCLSLPITTMLWKFSKSSNKKPPARVFIVITPFSTEESRQ
jgi:hypothetical protein